MSAQQAHVNHRLTQVNSRKARGDASKVQYFIVLYSTVPCCTVSICPGEFRRCQSEPKLALGPNASSSYLGRVPCRFVPDASGQARVADKPPARPLELKEDVTTVLTGKVEGAGATMSAWHSHRAGLCTPCLFYTRKSDGCRLGEACAFCHLCSPEQASRRRNHLLWQRRKEKRKASQQEASSTL